MTKLTGFFLKSLLKLLTLRLKLEILTSSIGGWETLHNGELDVKTFLAVSQKNFLQ